MVTMYLPTIPDSLWHKATLSLVFMLCLSLCACMKYQYQPDPVEPEKSASEFTTRHLHDPGLQAYLLDNGYQINRRPLDQWDLQALSLAACYFHPQLPIAITEYNLKKTLEQTASRRINPKINIP